MMGKRISSGSYVAFTPLSRLLLLFLFWIWPARLNLHNTLIWSYNILLWPTPTARQTLLFSATFSREVRAIAATTLRKGYTIVDTVGEEVEQTHSHGNDLLPSSAALQAILYISLQC